MLIAGPEMRPTRAHTHAQVSAKMGKESRIYGMFVHGELGPELDDPGVFATHKTPKQVVFICLSLSVDGEGGAIEGRKDEQIMCSAK